MGQKVSQDADGNVYYHLYMDIGDSIRSIDLTSGVISTPGGPGFKEGVLFDGMTKDGSAVYFSTKDALSTASNQDTDESTDIYRADVSEGSASLTRVSTGSEGSGNTDACDPVSNSKGPHWNAIGAEENCNAVAIGGGGGVAAQSGSIYFLSPEKLSEPANSCGIPCSGEEPVKNQPNLYLSVPGSEPRFIATLDPEDPEVLDALSEAETRHTADFQVTPSGEYAAFPSTEPLDQSYDNAEYSEIYRYAAQTGKLDCVSCDPTGVEPSFDSTLASNGLSLTDSGQVFFTTAEPLAARDQDEKKDVYEWEEDKTELISAGTSPFDSGLLTASANGRDVYFFTRDSLAPQDQNGPTMKIYDARSEGGFPYTPPPPPCAASDECHGPGSAIPPEPSIKTVEASTGGNVTPEKQVKKPGKRHHKKHQHRHRSHHAAHHKHG